MKSRDGVLRQTLEAIIGADRADRLFNVLVIHPAIAEDAGPGASRAVIAQALNMLLFEDLLARVPAAKLYVERCLDEGRTVMHDHGAVRTVSLAGMGALPVGELAITRILRPLGYALNGLYPLERLRMTGRSHAQSDFPEEIAQFFISELHPERFSAEFLAAVQRVTSTSVDPVRPTTYSRSSKRRACSAWRRQQRCCLCSSPASVGSTGRRRLRTTRFCSPNRRRWPGSLPREMLLITPPTALPMWTGLPLNKKCWASR